MLRYWGNPTLPVGRFHRISGSCYKMKQNLAAAILAREAVKIVSKIIFIIISSSLALALVGGLGVWKINEAEKRFDYFTDNILPSIHVLNDSKNDIWQVRVLFWKHLAEPDAAKKMQYESEITALFSDIDKNFEEYAAYVSDEQDKNLFERSKAIYAVYKSELKPMLDLSRRGDVPGAVRAASAGNGNDLIKVWDEHIAYNDRQSKLTDDANADATRRAQLQFVLIVLAAIVALATAGGLLSRSIRQGLARLQGAISDISRELDFRRRVASDGRDEVSLTAGDFDRLTTRLQHSLQSLQSGIVQVSTASQHLQDASQQVASSASQQSHASAQMAAAVEEMTVSLSHVADRANEAQALSAAGAQQASAGEQAIEQVVSDIGTIASTVSDTATQMTVLAERSQNIASVVSVIRDVADQTNLLALNAAIEAARAGESGRGFAVVADEVRKLAERTAASTQEIGQIIQAIQQVSGNVVTQMDQAVTQVARGQQGVASARVNMQQLLDGARQSAQLVAEISNAILEQSAATQSIARQVEQVAQGAESNSEAAGRAAGLADTLGSVALQMREEANRYRV